MFDFGGLYILNNGALPSIYSLHLDALKVLVHSLIRNLFIYRTTVSNDQDRLKIKNAERNHIQR